MVIAVRTLVPTKGVSFKRHKRVGVEKRVSWKRHQNFLPKWMEIKTGEGEREGERRRDFKIRHPYYLYEDTWMESLRSLPVLGSLYVTVTFKKERTFGKREGVATIWNPTLQVIPGLLARTVKEVQQSKMRLPPRTEKK